MCSYLQHEDNDMWYLNGHIISMIYNFIKSRFRLNGDMFLHIERMHRHFVIVDNQVLIMVIWNSNIYLDDES